MGVWLEGRGDVYRGHLVKWSVVPDASNAKTGSGRFRRPLPFIVQEESLPAAAQLTAPPNATLENAVE